MDFPGSFLGVTSGQFESTQATAAMPRAIVDGMIIVIGEVQVTMPAPLLLPQQIRQLRQVDRHLPRLVLAQALGAGSAFAPWK